MHFRSKAQKRPHILIRQKLSHMLSASRALLPARILSYPIMPSCRKGCHIIAACTAMQWLRHIISCSFERITSSARRAHRSWTTAMLSFKVVRSKENFFRWFELQVKAAPTFWAHYKLEPMSRLVRSRKKLWPYVVTQRQGYCKWLASTPYPDPIMPSCSDCYHIIAAVTQALLISHAAKAKGYYIK
jgi:hypothetical protein